MVDHDRYEYDVAISYAREDEPVARELGESLMRKNTKILYDEYGRTETGGSDFLTQIAELYRTKARYCVLLFSQHYPLKQWTDAERASARQHALRDSEKYILPVRLHDVEVPGLAEAKSYYDLRQSSVKQLTDWLEKKLGEAKPQSGPPEESHDLRSGHVP